MPSTADGTIDQWRAGYRFVLKNRSWCMLSEWAYLSHFIIAIEPIRERTSHGASIVLERPFVGVEPQTAEPWSVPVASVIAQPDHTITESCGWGKSPTRIPL